VSSEQHPTGGPAAEEDLIAVITVALTAIGSVAVVAATMWERVVSWLLQQHVVVADVGDPIVTLPASGGAGLDVPRLALLAAALVAATAVGVAGWRRRKDRRLNR